MERVGIDVSTFQGEIDWRAVKAAGIEFAMIRAGFGKEAGQIDEQFHRNMEGAAAAGIPAGAYWFSYAVSPEAAREEARRALAAVRPYRLEYPLAYDYEYDTVRYAAGQGVAVTRELATACIKAFCDEVAAAGWLPMVYTSLDYLRTFVDAEDIGRDVWLAQYNDVPTYGGAFTMWQRASSGRVEGVRGRVDLDICYRDYPSHIRENGLNGWGTADASAVPEPPAEKDEGEPAGIRAGDRVAYAGRLYGDSYGGSPGKTVDGVYTVDRVIEGRAYGIHIASGWLEAAKCRKAADAAGSSTPSAPEASEEPEEPGKPTEPADSSVPEPEQPAAPLLRVGATVRYRGRLYATSTGGGAGLTVDGTYTVSRILEGKSHGVLLDGGLGWVRPADCEVVG